MARIRVTNARPHRLLLSAAAIASVAILASAGAAAASPICLACHWGGDPGGLPLRAAASRPGFNHPPVRGANLDSLTPQDVASISNYLHSGASAGVARSATPSFARYAVGEPLGDFGFERRTATRPR
jgi:hypothetical protein